MLPLATIPFPEIDPNIFSVTLFGKDFALRWYSVAYMVGLIFGWWYIRRLCKRPGAPMSPDHMDDYLGWATLGVVIGGRLGYVFFYNFSAYLKDPIAIFRLWDGGMSFHGGALGVIVTVILFARKNRLPLFRVADMVAVVSPIGLLAGRVANFINGELWGRPTDVPWAMVFPRDNDSLPRHPSQLYEALGEGVLLFLLLLFLYHKTSLKDRRAGFIAGLFYLGYGSVRFMVEFVREPDAHLGLMGWISRGQVLTIPVFLFGFWLIYMSNQPNQPFQRKR